MSSFKAEKNSIEQIYEKYADLLYRLALVNLGSESDAEDAVHDCFMKYLEKQPPFNDDKHEEGWFVKVTVNICRDIMRKKKHRGYVPLEEIHHLKNEENEDMGILYYLEKISPRHRAVITLHYLEGYSVSEISEMLNISASAVKMRLSRGRELLKEQMEKEV